LFQRLPTFALTRDCAERAVEIDRELRSHGIRIPTADTLIAGVALARGLPLITRNRRHFARIPGLELVSLE
jgi:predicted nucleic acid-binding protein